jgi:hypothetical protein
VSCVSFQRSLSPSEAAEILRFNPDHFRTVMLRGRACYALGSLEQVCDAHLPERAHFSLQAGLHFQHALRLEAIPEVQIWIGHVHSITTALKNSTRMIIARNFSGAIAALTQALLAPQTIVHAKLFTDRSSCFLALSMYAECIADCTRALAIDPSNIE